MHHGGKTRISTSTETTFYSSATFLFSNYGEFYDPWNANVWLCIHIELQTRFNTYVKFNIIKKFYSDIQNSSTRFVLFKCITDSSGVEILIRILSLLPSEVNKSKYIKKSKYINYSRWNLDLVILLCKIRNSDIRIISLIFNSEAL